MPPGDCVLLCRCLLRCDWGGAVELVLKPRPGGAVGCGLLVGVGRMCSGAIYSIIVRIYKQNCIPDHLWVSEQGHAQNYSIPLILHASGTPVGRGTDVTIHIWKYHHTSI